MSGNFRMARLRFLVSQDQPNKSECKKIEEAKTGDSTLSSFPSFFFHVRFSFCLSRLKEWNKQVYVILFYS